MNVFFSNTTDMIIQAAFPYPVGITDTYFLPLKTTLVFSYDFK